MTPLQFSLYSKAEYIRALIRHFDTAARDDRVLLMTMTFEPTDPLIKELADSIERAAQRGVNILFGIDARTFLEIKGFRPGPLWLSSHLTTDMREPYGAIYQTIERLNSHENCRAVVINRPARRLNLPFAGRSHIKVAIFGNQVYVGGCNLDQSSDVDIMAGWRDQKTAGYLYEILERGVTTGNIRQAFGGVDRTLQLDDQTTLYIDAGVPDQSVILKNAFGMIDAARRWLVFTTQYFPNSQTAQHLLTAKKRGVNTRIIFSNLKRFDPHARLIQRVNRAIERTRLPADMFKDELPPDLPYWHAKLIACDQGAMIGSHNYVLPGVQVGTAEIALKSTDAEFAARAAEKLSSQLQALQNQIVK